MDRIFCRSLGEGNSSQQNGGGFWGVASVRRYPCPGPDAGLSPSLGAADGRLPPLPDGAELCFMFY